MKLRQAAYLTAACATIGGAVALARHQADDFQDRFERRARAALEIAGHDWAQLKPEGGAVALMGSAPDVAARAEAEALITGGRWGVHVVNRAVVETNALDAPPRYSVRIHKDAGGAQILGVAPSDYARDAINRRVAARLGGMEVAELTRSADGAPDPDWEQAARAAIDALPYLSQGEVAADSDGVRVTGVVPDADAQTAARLAVTHLAPDGVEVWIDLETPTLKISPYPFQARKTAGGALRISGAMPDADIAEMFLDRAGMFLSERLQTDITTGAGAPDEAWMDAALDGLLALDQLESGSFVMSDHDARLEGVGDAERSAKARTLFAELPPEYARSFRAGPAAAPQAANVETAAAEINTPPSPPVLSPAPISATAPTAGGSDAAEIAATEPPEATVVMLRRADAPTMTDAMANREPSAESADRLADEPATAVQADAQAESGASTATVIDIAARGAQTTPADSSAGDSANNSAQTPSDDAAQIASNPPSVEAPAAQSAPRANADARSEDASQAETQIAPAPPTVDPVDMQAALAEAAAATVSETAASEALTQIQTAGRAPTVPTMPTSDPLRIALAPSTPIDPPVTRLAGGGRTAPSTGSPRTVIGRAPESGSTSWAPQVTQSNLPAPPALRPGGAAQGASAPQPLLFAVVLRPDGRATITGSPPDAQTRQVLASWAAASFGADMYDDRMRVAPADSDAADWTQVAFGLMDVLKTLLEGEAKLSDGVIVMRGVTVEAGGRQAVADALAALRPAGYVVRDQITERTPEEQAPRSAAAGMSPGECGRLLGASMLQAPIDFPPGRTNMTRESAERVEYLALILKNCDNALIEIGGHTDSSGAARSNQRLSQRRAAAVRDKLVEMGVSAASLTVRGYGEVSPIADNSTRAGRAQNRRIEFKVSAREE